MKMTEQKQEIVLQENRAGQMSVGQLKEQVQIIQQVLAGVMKKGVHYDAIPGTGKYVKNAKTGKSEYVDGRPVLLKSGAEKINMVFRIGSEPVIHREFDGFDTHFHIVARMFHIDTGATLGYGVGEGSTSESKWAWRRAICHEEFEATLETQRRIHWQKKYKENYREKDEFEGVEQVRQNPADIINTVLKMAVKRAEVDGCRKVTACSDVFDQDIDEGHIREAVLAGEDDAEREQQQGRFQPPRRTDTKESESDAATEQPPANVISEAHAKRLYAIGKGRGFTNDEMSFLCFQESGVNSSREIPREKYDAVVAAFESAEPGKILAKESDLI
jgi:hypothetical protein